MDYYLRNPPRQPKSEIADYLASCGILVPRRFASFREAWDSGQPFILRSEHPDEYAGPSDLLISCEVHQNAVLELLEFLKSSDEQTNENLLFFYGAIVPVAQCMLRNQIDKIESCLWDYQQKRIEAYCRIAGQNPQAFREAGSYSYWQLLEGTNKSLVADSAVASRYHIFSEEGRLFDYSIYDNGRIASAARHDACRELAQRTSAHLGEDMGFYERIRELPRFDRCHCPIVEFQSTDKGNQFLQYHRTRDFQAPTFTLEQSPEPGMVQAYLVRGATPPGGLEINVAFRYTAASPATGPFFWRSGRASWTCEKICCSKRPVQLINVSSIERFADLLATRHMITTMLFKPGISVLINHEALGVTIEEVVRWSCAPFTASLSLKIVSDGRTAYMKRLA